jgi:IclR helix-turn-helix domain
MPPVSTAPALGLTSVDKALEICEVLGTAPGGMSLTELARLLKQPRPTVHRLLGLLKRRGYVRQDEETQRYSLTLKLLDLCFRQLGRSELRLHAYPVLREYVLRAGQRAFIAVPSLGEVTYLWSTGPDEIAMRTVYGREMPAHCIVYFDRSPGTRRLSCLRLSQPADLGRSEQVIARLGRPDAAEPHQRLICTCAPVFDYTGSEVARVGIFRHAVDDRPIVTEYNKEAWDLARHISMRLGHVPAPGLTGAA